MSGTRYALIRLGLEMISVLGLDTALAPRQRGAGVILTFHHVRPESLSVLPENAGLSITPAFLDAVLRLIRGLDYDIIPIGEMRQRLENPVEARPFAVLTFDDGYLDTRDHALPVLKRYDAPFAMFVCTSFADRSAPLWWLDLEEAMMRLDSLRLELPDGAFSASTGSHREKLAALRALYWRLRQLNETELHAAVDILVREAGVDSLGRVAELCMDWPALRAFAAEPLATIGAHSINHPRLAKLSAEDARLEIAGSRDRILAELGIDARHFAYPVGDPASAGAREYALARELGFDTALTTVPGVIKPAHLAEMTALPRISVNGLFQRQHYVRALMSGVPFMLKR